MAENRGGPNGGPQYNPANISATGGAGQSGKQPSRYISGMPYGQGQQLMQQQKSAPMSAPKMGAVSRGEYSEPMSKLRTLLDDTTNPLEPQSTGVDFGRGAGSEMMPQNLISNERKIENQAIVRKYLPAFANAAKAPGAPNSFKGFVNYMVGMLDA